MEATSSRYNYYEVLEISTSAPQHEVTTAYERAKATYSGENPAIYTIFSEDEARQLLSIVEEAYSVLGNKTLRALYDERLLGGNQRGSDLSHSALVTASKQFLPESKKTINTPSKQNYKFDAEFEKQMKETDSWNGSLIKKYREYKNLSVERVSEITKITAYYINAVESEDPKNLPAPVFVRGYVVQLAKTLGLDERKVADSYMKSFKAKLAEK